MNPVLEKISQVGLVPVIKLNDVSKAVPLARALAAGGIPAAEVTFRAAGAAEAIAAIAEEIPDVLVGAGTVTTIAQVDEAVAAGATYIISPGFDVEVVKYCVDKNILIIPGCASAGDVSIASKLGLEAVKFFPAEAAGGVKMLKALSGPFSGMKFIPTGGISPDNLHDYLSLPAVIACGGSWMVPEKLLDEGDFDGITKIAKDAVYRMLDVTLDHVGINSKDESEASGTVSAFSGITGASPDEIPVSYFVDKTVEVMKQNGKGTMGHLAYSVTSIERAMRFYESVGFAFDTDTIQYNEKGKIKFVYFKDGFGGFAVHLKLK